MERTRQPAAPAVLVALSMAICLGAAVDVSAASQSARARTDRAVTVFSAAEREALVSLLACLSDTARQFKPDDQQIARKITFSLHRLPAAAPKSALPTESAVGHDPLGPGTLAQALLLNLPPPAIA